MRQSKFLLGTSALVLLGGIGMASAQGPMPRDSNQPPAANQPSSQPSSQHRGKVEGQKSESQDVPGRKAPETTGQGTPAQNAPASSEKGQRGEKGKQDGASQPQRGQSNQKSDSQTTGQAPANRGQNQREGKPADAPAAQQGQSTQQPQGQNTQRSPSNVDQTQGQAGARVNLTTEQRTRIRETVLKSSDVPRATNVNISISVGTVVPRTIRLAPLPTIIVDVQPAWRGYMYFVVGDEIIVVEPNSMKIVAVIAV